MLDLVASALLTAQPAPSPATDVCLAMLPPTLSATLARQYPDYAAPLLTDAPPDRLLRLALAGDWPCPYVAVADVDGDGRLDRAVLLHGKTESTVKFVIARQVEGQWRIEVEIDWPIDLKEAFVEPLEPGLYEQTKADRNVAAQLDNLNAIQSDHAGFVAGQDAAAKQAFFLVNGEWQRLWLTE